MCAQLHRHPRLWSPCWIDEVDVERVLQGRMEGVVEVDAGRSNREPTVWTFGATRHIGGHRELRAHDQASADVRYVSNQEKIRCQPSNAASGRKLGRSVEKN